MKLNEDMEVAQAYVQFCLAMILDEHRDDLDYLKRLKKVVKDL